MFDRNGKSYSQLPVNEAAKVLGRTKALAASIIIVAESRLWCYNVPQGFSGEVSTGIIKLPIAKNVVTVSANNDLISTDCGKEEMNEKDV